MNEDFGGWGRHDGEVVRVVCEAAEIGAVGCSLADAWSVDGEFTEVGEYDGAVLRAVGDSESGADLGEARCDLGMEVFD